MRTNLPAPVSSTDSGAKTKLFFDEYGQEPLEFNANDVEAAARMVAGSAVSMGLEVIED